MKVKASAEEQERRQRILVAAWRLMSQKGIKAVTMDELTASLTMSKRTIYELLHDKKAIVRGLLMELSLPEKMKSVPQEGDALEYLLKMMLKGWNAYRTVSPLFFSRFGDLLPRGVERVHAVCAAASLQATRKAFNQGN